LVHIKDSLNLIFAYMYINWGLDDLFLSSIFSSVDISADI